MTILLPAACRKLLAALSIGTLMTATPLEAAGGGWQSLGDLSAWKPYGTAAASDVKWKQDGNAFVWQPGAGDLVTRELFSNFELELEWKLGPGGNSGLMFWVDESGAKPWHSGPEIQMLDDSKHKDGGNPLTSAGALYSLYPPAKSAAKPVGEWNALRLRVQGGRIQCWLNGEAIIDATAGSADWQERVGKSKFAPFAQFAREKNGRILLQDHRDPVSFRNLRIRRL